MTPDYYSSFSQRRYEHPLTTILAVLANNVADASWTIITVATIPWKRAAPVTFPSSNLQNTLNRAPGDGHLDRLCIRGPSIAAIPRSRHQDREARSRLQVHARRLAAYTSHPIPTPFPVWSKNRKKFSPNARNLEKSSTLAGNAVPALFPNCCLPTTCVQRIRLPKAPPFLFVFETLARMHVRTHLCVPGNFLCHVRVCRW